MESKTLSKAKKSLDMAIKVADNGQELENGKEYHINLSMLGTGKNEGTLQSFQGTVTFQDGVGRVSSNLYKQLGMGASIKFSNNNIELHGKDTDGFAISSTPNGINIIGREKDEQEIELDSTTPTTSNLHQKESLSKNLSNIKDAKAQLLDKKDKEQRQHRQDLRSESNRLIEEDFQHTIRNMNKVIRMILMLEQLNYKAADKLAMSLTISEGWDASDIFASKDALESSHSDVHRLLEVVDKLETNLQSGADKENCSLCSGYLTNVDLDDPNFMEKMTPAERRFFIKQNRDIITKIAHDNGKTSPEEIRALGNALFSSLGIDFFDPKYDEKGGHKFKLKRTLLGGPVRDFNLESKKVDGSTILDKPSETIKAGTPEETDGKKPRVIKLKNPLRDDYGGKTIEEIKNMKLDPGMFFDESKRCIFSTNADGSTKIFCALKFNESGKVIATRYEPVKKPHACRDMDELRAYREASRAQSSKLHKFQVSSDVEMSGDSYTVSSPTSPAKTSKKESDKSADSIQSTESDKQSSPPNGGEKNNVFEHNGEKYVVDLDSLLGDVNHEHTYQHTHLNHQLEGAFDQLNHLYTEIENLSLKQEQEQEEIDASFDDRTYRLLIRHLKMSKLDMKQELNQESTILENDKSLSQAKRKQLLIKKQEEIQKRQQKRLTEELLKQKLEQRNQFVTLLIKQSKERIKMTRLIKQQVEEIDKLCEQQPQCPVVDCYSLDELQHISKDLDQSIEKLDRLYTLAMQSGRQDLAQAAKGAKEAAEVKKTRITEYRNEARESGFRSGKSSFSSGLFITKETSAKKRLYKKGDATKFLAEHCQVTHINSFSSVQSHFHTSTQTSSSTADFNIKTSLDQLSGFIQAEHESIADNLREAAAHLNINLTNEHIDTLSAYYKPISYSDVTKIKSKIRDFSSAPSTPSTPSAPSSGN